jgi:hypothetical protein
MTSLLVEERGIQVLPTSTRECSAARAVCRALAEYLETLTFPVTGGLQQKFAVVRDLRAEPEDLGKYPGACVFPDGEAQYGTEEGSLQPIYDESGVLLDGTQLFLMGEIREDLQVHVWTNEVEHREYVLMMLEDAMNPVEWMSGFFLDMPHYHNLRASYQLMSMGYEDVDSDNQRRYRKCTLRVQATCPYARVFDLQRIRPRAAVEVD